MTSELENAVGRQCHLVRLESGEGNQEGAGWVLGSLDSCRHLRNHFQ